MKRETLPPKLITLLLHPLHGLQEFRVHTICFPTLKITSTVVTSGGRRDPKLLPFTIHGRRGTKEKADEGCGTYRCAWMLRNESRPRRRLQGLDRRGPGAEGKGRRVGRRRPETAGEGWRLPEQRSHRHGFFLVSGGGAGSSPHSLFFRAPRSLLFRFL
jgi:hypothetical protein